MPPPPSLLLLLPPPPLLLPLLLFPPLPMLCYSMIREQHETSGPEVYKSACMPLPRLWSLYMPMRASF